MRGDDPRDVVNDGLCRCGHSAREHLMQLAPKSNATFVATRACLHEDGLGFLLRRMCACKSFVLVSAVPDSLHEQPAPAESP